MTERATAPGVVSEESLRRMRILGAVLMGLAIGVMLVPALFDLLSKLGDVTAFRYQNF